MEQNSRTFPGHFHCAKKSRSQDKIPGHFQDISSRSNPGPTSAMQYHRSGNFLSAPRTAKSSFSLISLIATKNGGYVIDVAAVLEDLKFTKTLKFAPRGIARNAEGVCRGAKFNFKMILKFLHGKKGLSKIVEVV